MPQKRNPVALEHARAIASKALGQAGAISLAVHNTPFGDIVDTEDDLQPLVFSMYADAARAVQLVAAAMATATFDRDRLAARAREGWITVTELADTLTRDHGVAFKTSHAIATRFVGECSRSDGRPQHEILHSICADIVGREIRFSADELAKVLSPEHFVDMRATPGGPAVRETTRAVGQSRARLAEDQRWREEMDNALRRAEGNLRTAAASL